MNARNLNYIDRSASLSNANLRQFNQILVRLLLHKFLSARADSRWMLDNEFGLPQLARAVIPQPCRLHPFAFAAPPPIVSGFAEPSSILDRCLSYPCSIARSVGRRKRDGKGRSSVKQLSALDPASSPVG